MLMMFVSIEGIDKPRAVPKGEGHIGMDFFMIFRVWSTSSFGVIIMIGVVGGFVVMDGVVGSFIVVVLLVVGKGLPIAAVDRFEEVVRRNARRPWMVHVSQNVGIVCKLLAARGALTVERVSRGHRWGTMVIKQGSREVALRDRNFLHLI